MKTIAAVLLLIACTASAANTYKCTEGGKTVYTNQPCAITAPTDTAQELTAAQIQADFERERDLTKRQAAPTPTRIVTPAAPQLPPAVVEQTPTPSGSNISGIFFIVFLIGIYFLPAIIAGGRDHHNQTAIFFLNFLLGWSGLGWIAAFIWSVTAVRRTEHGKLID